MSNPQEVSKKLSLVAKKESVSILYELKYAPKRFSDLPGNTDTRSRRLHELEESGLIEPTLLQQGKRNRKTVAYKITEKGTLVLRDAEALASQF
jgi:DNA-binding HxlR family transcriptional regulator